MKYKCPNCGRINLSMYCDTCNKGLSNACAVTDSETRKFFVQSHSGSRLEVYDTYLIHIFKNQSFMNNTENRKRLNFVDISSVQLKEPSRTFAGYVQFSYMGSVENTNRYSNVFSAVGDENSFLFVAEQLPLMRQIVDFIDRRRGELKTAPQVITTSQTSAATEIKKFKELLDSGIITQEEFNAKKKQLLNL